MQEGEQESPLCEMQGDVRVVRDNSGERSGYSRSDAREMLA